MAKTSDIKYTKPICCFKLCIFYTTVDTSIDQIHMTQSNVCQQH